ncbi:O-antigen ligase family protein [Segetibacter aerophilus]|uniref:O-antigen ligase-related domain-containing protein n=1 Tax=Segetibacter aerophilus TaxID=670293 RepID=A0A512BFN7_9BACT|nr:O-antigen ligase family protein [Segetibacter aerophilus]GEO10781.1 hypothetical protein SAE01_32770 [Segetibacter aerophilus]
MEEVEIILNKGRTGAGGTPHTSKSISVAAAIKNNKLLAFILFIAAALIASSLVANMGVVGGVICIAAVIGLPFVYTIVVYPNFGIIFLLVLAYFLMFILRYLHNVPLGTAVDSLEVLFILGFFIKMKKEKNWEMVKGPTSILILAWIFYNLLQVFNPSAESILAWVYTVRSVGLLMLLYFIFVYNVRTISFIKLILKVWILLSIVAALYALKQEFIGFSAVEEEYLYSDPIVSALLFIDGAWRKFSIFSDPVTFSYNMAASSLLCIALITGPLRLWKKLVLGFLAALFLYVMVFSGTRGAYVLIPATLLLFAILKCTKTMMATMMVVGAFFVILIFIPTGNVTLYRFQSAFRPSNDASYNLRKANQKKIRPYILSHPMGGGLGSTGVWGVKFAPTSYLASFPPDSGYVRVAVEMGWIGLFLFCLLMFTILKTGVNNFYSIQDAELKSYCLAMTMIVFAWNIGNFPQEAFVQFPTNVYFYLVAALITVTYRIDKEKQAATKQVELQQNTEIGIRAF